MRGEPPRCRGKLLSMLGQQPLREKLPADHVVQRETAGKLNNGRKVLEIPHRRRGRGSAEIGVEDLQDGSIECVRDRAKAEAFRVGRVELTEKDIRFLRLG